MFLNEDTAFMIQQVLSFVLMDGMRDFEAWS
jgi:hypothetical protein